MKLIALMLARNEQWTLEASVRAALGWCDAIVILNHASTDGTADVLHALQRQFPNRVLELYEPDPVWNEMTHRQRTLETARQAGATHCAIVDADEILCEHMVAQIRPIIATLQPGEVLQIPWVILWRSLDMYRSDDSVWARAFASMAFCDAPALRWEAREHGYQHHHRHPMGSTCRQAGRLAEGGLLHYQHASWRRLLAKQALYQMREMIHYPHMTAAEIRARYGPTVNEDGLARTRVPLAWWGAEKNFIRLDEAPWQEAECWRLIQEHGRAKFAGVDLLGVV
jgi:Glycosyl transferase family 2